MSLGQFKNALARTSQNVVRHHTFQSAAALSYYFVLATFPALIFLAAVLGSIPLPDLFSHVLGVLSRLLPSDTIKLVISIIQAASAVNPKAWIPVSITAVLWVAAAAFDALIEALDIAYDVNDPRPFWKTRLLGLVLTAVSGTLLFLALCVMILGPRFASWLAVRISLSPVFVLVWPPLHWIIAIAFTVLAVEVIYFMAPNIEQRFWATLPGALLAVGFWLGLSYLLGIYFRHVAHYSLLYGSLSGFIAFMTWLYWTSFALMVGAELNSELAKATAKGALLPKEAGGRENIGRVA